MKLKSFINRKHNQTLVKQKQVKIFGSVLWLGMTSKTLCYGIVWQAQFIAAISLEHAKKSNLKTGNDKRNLQGNQTIVFGLSLLIRILSMSAMFSKWPYSKLYLARVLHLKNSSMWSTINKFWSPNSLAFRLKAAYSSTSYCRRYGMYMRRFQWASNLRQF